MLNTRLWGHGPAVVLVHGFTQSGAGWGPVGEELGRSHSVVAPDAPGHGGSSAVHADLWSGADLLSAAVEPHLHGAPADWIGYSMGGRYCLHVALSHPEQVRRLVLVSATGGIDDEHERARRRQGDEALANRVEEIGVEAFLQQWLSQPLFATLPPHAAGIEARLDSTASGLASSLRLAGTGTQDPLWDRLGTLAMPVLIVAGELDHKYVQLGRRLVEAIGDNAELAVIDGAGHACHLEQPDRFLALVAPFLADG